MRPVESSTSSAVRTGQNPAERQRAGNGRRLLLQPLPNVARILLAHHRRSEDRRRRRAARKTFRQHRLPVRTGGKPTNTGEDPAYSLSLAFEVAIPVENAAGIRLNWTLITHRL